MDALELLSLMIEQEKDAMHAWMYGPNAQEHEARYDLLHDLVERLGGEYFYNGLDGVA